MKRLTGLTLLLALVAACGTATDRPVKALNLATGEKKDFTSQDAIPDGWAPCPDDACTVPPTNVPCQNLGAAVCSANTTCRLKKLGCYTQGCAGPVDPVPGGTPGASGGSSDGSAGSAGSGSGSSDPGVPTDFADSTPGEPTDPTDPGAPTDPTDPTDPVCNDEVVCEYACVPKTPLQCDELENQGDCATRSDCQWQELGCGMDCPPGADCPPCGGGYCAPKAPPSCESLDQATCGKRNDCEWAPGVCPMLCPAGEANCGAPCQSFCQTKSDPPPPPPTCPPIAPPPPGFCQDGQLLPKYDAQGCIVGFDCTNVCPDIAAVYPECPDGVVVPKYNAAGCLVGYECKKKTGDCDQLAADYAQALKAAKKCNPFSASMIMQCSVEVADSLLCGCTTYVNMTNSAAIQTLKDIQTKAQNAQCFAQLACPAIACWAPTGGTCEVDGVGATTGTCTDVQPN